MPQSKININKKCKMCNSEMIIKNQNKIGETIYYMLYCEKCHYSCARSQ